ncbi:MAG: DNA (cytosine-5)-methyltransferase 1 [Verrucomicrobiales bacterium]|jgi:DNA (cytosine-5)-methyltransferase 1
MLECIDLFCGAGGLSLGLKRAGFSVSLAMDMDAKCELTYRSNFADADFIRADITQIEPELIRDRVSDAHNLVLAGGPPCQLFSRLNKKPRSNSPEVTAYMKLIQVVQPGFVVFENVPAIRRRSDAWKLVTSTLRRLGYFVEYGILKGVDFGLAQKRERMIVIAGRVPVELPSGFGKPTRTVKDIIGGMPDQSESIPNHVSLRMSDENLRRIRKLREGENSRRSGTSFSDSYSRMSWDSPAPTMTTKCISFSNGRFGHPQYDRALTVREAALLQGFPNDFEFKGDLWSCAKQVGNAVPPPIGMALGQAVLKSVAA